MAASCPWDQPAGSGEAAEPCPENPVAGASEELRCAAESREPETLGMTEAPSWGSGKDRTPATALAGARNDAPTVHEGACRPGARTEFSDGAAKRSGTRSAAREETQRPKASASAENRRSVLMGK